MRFFRIDLDEQFCCADAPSMPISLKLQPLPKRASLKLLVGDDWKRQLLVVAFTFAGQHVRGPGHVAVDRVAGDANELRAHGGEPSGQGVASSKLRRADWGEVVRMREHDRPPVAHTLTLNMPHVRSYSKYCVQYLALVCFLNFVSQFFVRVSKAAFILGGNRVKQWTVGRQVPDFF